MTLTGMAKEPPLIMKLTMPVSLSPTLSRKRARERTNRYACFTLTKAELTDSLFEKIGLNKHEAKNIVESFFEEIRTKLEVGEIVKLPGFGNFQVRDKPQRPGRNPQTGEEIPISARRVVTFHPSRKLRDMVEKRCPAEPQA